MQKAIFISGGFGNLLFQFVGFTYLKKIPEYSEIKVNKYLISQNFLTEKILKWKIHSNESELIFKKEDIIELNNFQLMKALLNMFFSKTFNLRFFRCYYLRTEHDKVPRDLHYFMGYFQNIQLYEADLFWDCVNELRRSLKINSLVQRVSVHLRFGDSVWALQHMDYYKRAISEAKSFGLPVYVVTDDLKRANELLEEMESEFRTIGTNLIDDFRFLAESSVCICAPSTFSWWAAIINSGNKRIVMPKFFKHRFPIDRAIIYL